MELTVHHLNMKSSLALSVNSSVSVGVLVWLCCAFNAHAQPVGPQGGAKSDAPASFLQCTPLTPDSKVPWIDVAQLPDFTNAYAFFEGCTDADYAWTTQSYPNPKFVPPRAPEHQARVLALLQGLKAYVAAESDDWVGYVNTWLGTTLPPSKIRRSTFPNGNVFSSLVSYSETSFSSQYEFSSKIFGVYGTQVVTPGGAITSNNRRLSITGIDTEKLCITPVDLQPAFENQHGYLLRPMSVRTARNRPNPAELAKLGGQWFGYDVRVLNGPSTWQYRGDISFGFGFKPCAADIQVSLTKALPSETPMVETRSSPAFSP